MAGRSDFVVDLTHGDLPRGSLVTSGVRSFSVERESRVVYLDMYELTATIELSGRRIGARLSGAWPMAVDVLLRNALQFFGIETGRALILHASSVERGGEGYVFMGHAEAGKSTVAVLSREAGVARLLREEFTCLGLVTGDRPLEVFALPFREKNRLSAASPVAVPLRGLYWLEQASADSVERIGVPEQVRRLAMATSICVRDKMLMIPALELAEQIVRRVPVRVLRFRSRQSSGTPSTKTWHPRCSGSRAGELVCRGRT